MAGLLSGRFLDLRSDKVARLEGEAGADENDAQARAKIALVVALLPDLRESGPAVTKGPERERAGGNRFHGAGFYHTRKPVATRRGVPGAQAELRRIKSLHLA